MAQSLQTFLRRWLARLSVSFLIIGAAIAYTGFDLRRDGQITRSRQQLYYAGAIFCAGLFVLGTRLRHAGVLDPPADDTARPTR